MSKIVPSIAAAFICTSLSWYSSSAMAACSPEICGDEPVDISGITEKIEENKKNLSEAKASASKSLLSDMFSYKDELPGKQCLDGLLNTNISNSFVDITTGYPKLLNALLEQIMNAACAAVVDAANSEITAMNDSINSFGEEMNEASGGLMDLSSSTSTGDGDFIDYDVEVKSIQDMPVIQEESRRWSERVEKEVYGSGGYQGGGSAPTDIDLSDDRFYKNRSSIEGEYDVMEYDLDADVQRTIDNASCWLSEDC